MYVELDGAYVSLTFGSPSGVSFCVYTTRTTFVYQQASCTRPDLSFRIRGAVVSTSTQEASATDTALRGNHLYVPYIATSTRTAAHLFVYGEYYSMRKMVSMLCFAFPFSSCFVLHVTSS